MEMENTMKKTRNKKKIEAEKLREELEKEMKLLKELQLISKEN